MKDHSSLHRDKTPVFTKCGLAALFLIGVLLLSAGLGGRQIMEADGFSSENAYRVIYALS